MKANGGKAKRYKETGLTRDMRENRGTCAGTTGAGFREKGRLPLVTATGLTLNMATRNRNHTLQTFSSLLCQSRREFPYEAALRQGKQTKKKRTEQNSTFVFLCMVVQFKGILSR